ncbi:hypothetical protein [Peribacillus simplex]|nr:hypothetical protein [Peribacillus simplex]
MKSETWIMVWRLTEGLGFNFLKQAGALIDARALELKTGGC